MPLIPGADGRKMGKTFNNTVDILTPAPEMYGKIMSMSDDVLPLYFEVLTDAPLAEIDEMKRVLAVGSVNPMELKMRLARDIVAQFHSPAAAAEAETAFDRQFRRRELPEDMPVHVIDAATNIVDLMVAAGLASSKSEARRLIDGGGVRVASDKVARYDLLISPETPAVVQVGRRRFVRVRGK